MLAPGMVGQRVGGRLTIYCSPGEGTRKRRRGAEERERQEEGAGEVEQAEEEEEEDFDPEHVLSLVCSREGFGVCTMMKRGKNHRTK